MYVGAGLLDIILLAAVAIFLIMRLRSILGTRTGHEKPPRDLFNSVDEDNGVTANDEEGPILDHEDFKEKSALAVGITQQAQVGLGKLKQVDKQFDLDRFCDGVGKVFPMVLESFAAGDTETLSALLAPSVYKAFLQSIQKREKNHYRQEIIIESIQELAIQEVEVQDNHASISVIIDSEQVNVTYDQENKPIIGDPNHITRVKDLWVFHKPIPSDDPTWLLSETKTIET